MVEKRKGNGVFILRIFYEVSSLLALLLAFVFVLFLFFSTCVLAYIYIYIYIYRYLFLLICGMGIYCDKYIYM